MSINTFADTRTYCTTNSNITQQGVFAFYDALTRNKTFSYRQCSICQKAVGVVSRRAVPRARDRILGRGAASPPPHQLEDLGESCKLPRTFGGIVLLRKHVKHMVISIISNLSPKPNQTDPQTNIFSVTSEGSSSIQWGLKLPELLRQVEHYR